MEKQMNRKTKTKAVNRPEMKSLPNTNIVAPKRPKANVASTTILGTFTGSETLVYTSTVISNTPNPKALAINVSDSNCFISECYL